MFHLAGSRREPKISPVPWRPASAGSACITSTLGGRTGEAHCRYDRRPTFDNRPLPHRSSRTAGSSDGVRGPAPRIDDAPDILVAARGRNRGRHSRFRLRACLSFSIRGDGSPWSHRGALVVELRCHRVLHCGNHLAVHLTSPRVGLRGVRPVPHGSPDGSRPPGDVGYDGRRPGLRLRDQCPRG